MAAALVRRGHQVTMLSASYPGAKREEMSDGIRMIRRGGRLTVYLWAALLHLRGSIRRHDVVIDVQNAIPFFTPLYCRQAKVVLVHHVHREQWPVCFGPVRARIGWWIESRLAPWLYRRTRYVTVSQVTREELASLGVDRKSISVVYNGTTRQAEPVAGGRTPYPSVCVLGRLVPHKRVEYALEAVARLRSELPGLRLTVVGEGYWHPRLLGVAHELGVEDVVEFTGFVDDTTKQAILARSWVLAQPSLKEGWGLVVVEAAVHGVPTVAFRSAGGLAESVVDGTTGLLTDDLQSFTAAIRSLLVSEPLRTALGQAAASRAPAFTWEASAHAFTRIVEAAVAERLAARRRAWRPVRRPVRRPAVASGYVAGDAATDVAGDVAQRLP
jgi:glycosyltransferase involved in cell wall biosynthesis